MIEAAPVILAFVTLQRLAELVIARRNTRFLLAQGAYEVAPGHYPLIVAVHASWLGALWWFAPGQPVAWWLVALFALLQLGRVWVLATLGSRWTTRIIVVPGEKLVERGPFQLVRHPNYLIVILELAFLQLAFGLWKIAFLFSLLNAAVLTIRIRTEEKALAAGRAR